jgi:glutamate formiminotransferase
MMTLVECVPNFSEGRRGDVIDEIVAAIAAIDGVHVLDRQSDATHNRSVITLAGPVEAAAEAAFGGIAAAARLIDLNRHSGAHPRFGAADVVPFVPLRDDDMPACVEAARSLAARVARELQIPTYLYEEAALRPEHRNLADVRRGQFEGLREAIGVDPARAPDHGPRRVHPTAGAVAIGARVPLIAYNVDLESNDVELARAIAVAVREKDGGFPRVKAMGLALDDCVQVSMNLVDHRVTPIRKVFDEIARRAAAHGVRVRRSEIVGLLPLAAVVDVVADVLLADELTRRQVLEARVLDALSGDG